MEKSSLNALISALALSTIATKAKGAEIDETLGICDDSSVTSGQLASVNSGGYNAAGTGFHQVTVPGDARCNDGTDPIMFINPADNSSNDWLIYIHGGSSCTSYQDCRDRWRGVQGNGTFTCSKMSSARYTDSIGDDDDDEVGLGGIMASVDPFTGGSTLFANYNRVIFHYCSSDQWMGDASAPKTVRDVERTVFNVTRFNGVSEVCVTTNHGYAVGDEVHVDVPSHPSFSGTVTLTGVNVGCFEYLQPAQMSVPFSPASGTAHRSFDLWFQGHRILKTLFSKLLEPVDTYSDDGAVSVPPLSEIDSSSMVVIAGDSAGSGGARLNSEWMWNQMNGALPIEQFRFVLDASGTPSREREDVNPNTRSCDLYTHDQGIPDPDEPLNYTSPDDTWTPMVQLDHVEPIYNELWSAFGGPQSCVTSHLAQPAGALPVEACLDNGHVGAVHFPWPMFQRQALDDDVVRPSSSLINCATSLPLQVEWAQRVETQFDIFHEYASGDRQTHAISAVQRRLFGRRRVCIGPHDIQVGDRIRVQTAAHPAFNRRAALVVSVTTNCVEYMGSLLSPTPPMSASGVVHRMLYSAPDDALYFLGAHDGAEFTGAPCEAFPSSYASFAPACAKHDAILSSLHYFQESIFVGSPPPYTLQQAVESFVTGGGVPAQLQDAFPVVSGYCP